MQTEQWKVIPAVDLLGDKAVRLEQGDFERVRVRRDPDELVRRFVAAGAELVHVVDLDGARRGVLRPELVERLARAAAPARIQASGGIRSLADAERLGRRDRGSRADRRHAAAVGPFALTGAGGSGYDRDLQTVRSVGNRAQGPHLAEPSSARAVRDREAGEREADRDRSPGSRAVR